jgi:phosphoribosylamine--glycine ligase
MNILVIGSGGREHALVWKLAHSKSVNRIYCIPGNGGISRIAECVNIDISKFDKLSEFVKEKKISLTVVGPEAPLVSGIVDYFKSEGLEIFGPDKKCAQFEGSKIFAKKFMKKYNIPTAEFETFDNYDAAIKYTKDYTDKISSSVVIKADGLCAGKGVVVCDTYTEAERAINNMLLKKEFGQAGEKIVIEKRLFGEEISVLAFCDSETILPLPVSQDHKRVFDDDKGPNTGGMGAFAPVPFVKKDIIDKIKTRIFDNFIKGLKSENLEYKGIIYFGLLISENNPYVLEFNVRFGDPETQPVLSILESDLVDLILATIEHKLNRCSVKIRDRYAVCVVIASGGYPGAYQKGKEITGLDKVKDVTVFHAGTKYIDGKFYTDGGRVLGVTGTGKTLQEAITNTYDAVSLIKFENMHYRKDIGRRGIVDKE